MKQDILLGLMGAGAIAVLAAYAYFESRADRAWDLLAKFEAWRRDHG